MRLRLIALSLVGTLLTLPSLAADDSQPPAQPASQPPLDRLKTAADLTALDSSSLRPWHWKLDISVFDKTGANPQAGSLEMWFSDGNLRSVESLGGKQITTLRIGNNLYRTSDDEKDLAPISLIEMQILHPIPGEVSQPSTVFKQVQEAVGAVKLDCLTPEIAPQSGDPIANVQAISFCFEQDSAKLLVTEEPGNFSILRPRVGVFESHQVPVDLQTFSGGVMLSEAKTTKLDTEPVDPSLFQVKPDMGPVTAPVDVPVTDLRGMVLSKNPPVYPPEARAHHVTGSVILDATIGKDGHVVSPQATPLSTPALIASAKEAVSHWVFRPYLINGVPVEVKTQFTEVFGGGPRPQASPATDDDQPTRRGR